MRGRLRLLLTLTGAALVALGVGGFVAGPYVSANVPLSTSRRFPLGDLESVDTDTTGRVYVVDGFYHRVQRFDPSGLFEIGWRIDAAGPFRLRVMPDSTVEVAVAKAKSVLIYTADGKPVARRPLNVPFERFAAAGVPVYSVRGALSPRPGVIRLSDGQRVVSDSLPLLLVRGPFPAWCFGLVGIALLSVIDRKRLRRRAR